MHHCLSSSLFFLFISIILSLFGARQYSHTFTTLRRNNQVSCAALAAHMRLGYRFVAVVFAVDYEFASPQKCHSRRTRRQRADELRQIDALRSRDVSKYVYSNLRIVHRELCEATDLLGPRYTSHPARTCNNSPQTISSTFFRREITTKMTKAPSQASYRIRDENARASKGE